MTWHSQAGQDEWVHSIIGDNGFYVDIGAYDGIEHSNTYALEQEYGWKGICVEPQWASFERLVINRPTAIVSHSAILNHAGMAAMRGDTVVASHSLPHHHPGAYIVPCSTLPELLIAAEAPSIIDYLSIDTEGCEVTILEAMDFDRWHVKLMTVEHNAYRDGSGEKVAQFELLTARGFKRVRDDVVAPGYGPYEDWWVSGEMTLS